MSEKLRKQGPLNVLKKNVQYRKERMQERIEETKLILGDELKPNPVSARRLSQGMSSILLQEQTLD